MAVAHPNQSRRSGLSTRAARHGVWVLLACIAGVIVWGNHRLEVLLLLGFLAPLTTAHVLSMALVGSVCWGVDVERISIFFGEPLCRFRVGGIPIELGYWPTGGSATFHRNANGETTKQGVRSYDHLHPWQRLVVILSGPSLLLLLGYAFIGGNSLLSILHKFLPALAGGTMSPGNQGVETLRTYFGYLEQGAYRTAFGILAVVVAGVHLLPLLTLNGGEALLEAAQMLIRRKLAFRAVTALRAASLLMVWAIMVPWAYAFFLAVFIR